MAVPTAGRVIIAVAIVSAIGYFGYRYLDKVPTPQPTQAEQVTAPAPAPVPTPAPPPTSASGPITQAAPSAPVDPGTSRGLDAILNSPKK